MQGISEALDLTVIVERGRSFVLKRQRAQKGEFFLGLVPAQEGIFTDLCGDTEFTVPKQSSVVDGGQHPFPASLFRRTDRSGIEGNPTECR